LLIGFGSCVASGQHPWQTPPERNREDVEQILGVWERTEPTRDLRIVWVWGVDRNHAEGFHEYVKVRDKFVALLKRVPRVTVETAEQYPSAQQWQTADLVVFYVQLETLKQQDFALMDALLSRGGGLIAIHAAFIQQPSGEELAARFGLAWNRNITQWGVLPIPAKIDTAAAHGIFDRFPTDLDLVDEHYWKLTGSLDEITVLATAQAGPVRASKGPPAPEQLDGKRWPLFWTKEIGTGRVFGSIPGHNLFTFDDPYFRIILLRAMAWTMRQPMDPFKPLVTEGI
jgi:type 1 glutamine amidotransferase